MPDAYSGGGIVSRTIVKQRAIGRYGVDRFEVQEALETGGAKRLAVTWTMEDAARIVRALELLDANGGIG